MSFKTMKTSVALASALSLTAFGLVAAPAQAADGDVDIAPKTGTGTTAFSTDNFELTTEIKTSLGLTAANLAYRIDNPDQHTLHIDTDSAEAEIHGIKADGSLVTAGDLSTAGEQEAFGAAGLVVPFEDLEIVSLLIMDLTAAPTATGNDLTIQLDENTDTAANDNKAVDALEHGDLTSPVAITVNAWVETGVNADVTDHLTIDSAYSDSIAVTFVDPSAVTPILKLERQAQLASSNGTGDYSVLSVRAAATGNVGDIAGAVNDVEAGDTLDGVTLAEGDLILLPSQGTASETGVYSVGTDAAPTAVDVDFKGLVYAREGTTNKDLVFSGDGANAMYLVTGAGTSDVAEIAANDGTNDIESGDTLEGHTIVSGDVVLLAGQDTAAENGLYTTDDDAPVASDVDVDFPVYVNKGDNAGSVFFGDGANALPTAPSSTLDLFNAANDNVLSGSLRFSNADVNLQQVDLSNWDFSVDGAATDDTGFVPGELLEVATPAGHTKTDALGRLLVTLPLQDNAVTESETFKWTMRHQGATSVTYDSPGFQVITSPEADADEIFATISDDVNASIGSVSSNKFPVTVRNGTESVTFTAQVEKADGTDQGSNIPVLAVVTAGANFAVGETISVTGTSDKIETSSGTVITQGLTDSDGQYSVTVTSSDVTSASAKFDIEFYALDESTTPDAWTSTHSDGGAVDAEYNVDYAAASIASTGGFAASSSVLSGESITVSFDVEDQFGQPLSASAKGAAYSVQLQATDDDNLDLDVAVVDGTATFTFDNYLGDGESDVLTAKLYTGSAASPTFVSGQTANTTLYNSGAISAITATDKVTGKTVTYSDFFEGKAGTGDTVPTNTKGTISGTVVDSNGTGIPGAAVNLSASGFMFEVANSYSVDSIDVVANTAGAFEVDFWTNVLTGADGVDVTITSGGATATTEVVTSLPTTLDAANLVFTWSVPEVTVMNTTYAVVASLKDVWGNPIAGQNIDFAGLAAAEFNAKTTATRATGADGTATAYLRSVKDVDGLAAISATIDAADTPTGVTTFNNDDTANVDDVASTSWDESLWNPVLDQEITFLASAADAPTDAKVNAGSFKGYVAVYAKGYEGQRLSAKIGNDWVVVPALASNFERIVDFTGAGVDIAVRIYIDRVLMDTINLTTK